MFKVGREKSYQNPRRVRQTDLLLSPGHAIDVENGLDLLVAGADIVALVIVVVCLFAVAPLCVAQFHKALHNVVAAAIIVISGGEK